MRPITMHTTSSWLFLCSSHSGIKTLRAPVIHCCQCTFLPIKIHNHSFVLILQDNSPHRKRYALTQLIHVKTEHFDTKTQVHVWAYMSVFLFCVFYVCFSSKLLNLFSEIHYWDRLKFEIPHCACDIYQDREELRVLRERTLLLTRNYNRSQTHTHKHGGEVCMWHWTMISSIRAWYISTYFCLYFGIFQLK